MIFRSFCLFSLILYASFVYGQESLVNSFVPRNILYFDILNIQDNYPALLFSLERQFTAELGIEQEFGYVLAPETYDNLEVDKYLGFKGRTELKLYKLMKTASRVNNTVAFDISYQSDQYVLEYLKDNGSFFSREVGVFTRWVIGSHIRFGSVYHLFNERFILAWSVGVGRSFYKLNSPDNAQENNTFSITTNSVLDPFSANARIKIGWIVKK